MKNRWLFAGILFLVVQSTSIAQSLHYFIGFTNKEGTAFSVNEPDKFLSEKALLRRQRQNIAISARDLPVSAVYLDSIRSTGAQVIYTSKWVNAALVLASETQIKDIRSWEFTQDLPYVTRGMSNNAWATTEEDYGASFGQADMIGLDEMHAQGYTGEGITIAVLDGGFVNGNTDQSLRHVETEGRLLSTFDFVEGDENVFRSSDHGRQVYSIIASYQPQTMIGGAYGASFHLFRTENVAIESRLEEIYWIVAAERADSLGVDIIVSSLGYTLFDLEEDSYSVEQLDGETALVTDAADWAAATGMLVVTSVGNEGNDPWKKVTPPADADSVLSVGAVNANGEYMEFSSLGPTVDDRIKPEIAAQGWFTITSNGGGGTRSTVGTSFSCPLVASLAAGLWQARPELTNMEVIEAITKTASQAEAPDNRLGYGIPDFERALAYEMVTALETEGELPAISIFPNPFETSFSIEIPTEALGNQFDIRIFTLQGKEVHKHFWEATTTKQTLIFPQEIPAGVYLLRVATDRGAQTFRMIKS